MWGVVDTPLGRRRVRAGYVVLADHLIGRIHRECLVCWSVSSYNRIMAGIEAAADDPLDFTLIIRTLFPGRKKETIAYELRGQGDNCVDG